MFEVFLIIALSVTSFHKNRNDNIGICEGNNNTFCTKERLSLENDIKALEKYEKDFPSES